MPTNTTNFSLIKPGQEEFYNVDVSNANMDTIDGVLKTLQDAISSGASEQDLKILRDALATHLAEEASLTKAGHVMLSNLINGSSEGKAATELAVKNAKEAAINFTKSFGLGDVAKSITGSNLNDIVLNGTYMGQNLVNAPNNFWYFIEHFQHNESFAKQVAHPFTDYGANNPTLYRLKLSGAWQPWTRYLDSTMINVPNGVIGLDASGNMPASLGVEAYKLLYTIDFSQNPTATLAVGNLGGYKKIRAIGRKLNGTLTTARNVYVKMNNLAYNSPNAYMSTLLRSSIISSATFPVSALTIGGQAPGAISEFILDIDNPSGITPRYTSSYQQYNYQGNLQDYSRILGTFNAGNTFANISPVTSIDLEVFNNTGGEVINSGTLEVWGVPR